MLLLGSRYGCGVMLLAVVHMGVVWCCSMSGRDVV